MRRRFAIDGDAEIDPRTLDLGHGGALAAMGVTRASLGVQDFDSAVQRPVGRVQPYNLTARAVDWLRRAGIASLYVELMYGLALQTIRSMEDFVTTARSLEPDDRNAEP